MASTAPESEQLLKTHFADLNRAFDTVSPKVALFCASLGSPPSHIQAIQNTISKGSMLLFTLEARINVDGSWDTASERLGQPGLCFLDEANKALKSLDGNIDNGGNETCTLLTGDTAALAGTVAMDRRLYRLALLAKRRMKEACLAYLGALPDGEGAMSTKKIVTKLEG
ncbi:hypothetical protein VTG60DRAFT_7175 [Thermothelomyces hinnuleus]